MPLRIGTHTIDHISGPVYGTLLKPNQVQFDKYKSKGLVLPLMLLLGDLHAGMSNACKTCSTPTCVTIDSPNFFQIFNEYSTPDHLISFNIEEFVGPELKGKEQNDSLDDLYQKLKRQQKQIVSDEDGFNNNTRYKERNFLNSTIQTTFMCYFHEYKQQSFYDLECPAPNLIYNYVDIRKSDPHSRYDRKRTIEAKIITCLEAIVERLHEVSKQSQTAKRTNVPEQVLRSWGVANKEQFYEWHIQPYFRELQNKYQDVWTSVGYLLQDNLEPFADMLLDHPNSKIAKQFHHGIIDRPTAKKLIQKAIEQTKKFYRIQKYIPYINQLGEYLVNGEVSMDSMLKDDMYNTTNAIIDADNAFTASFLDLYYIFRMLKTRSSQQGMSLHKKEFLSLSYLGVAHCQNIQYYLVDILGLYEIEDSTKKVEYYNRCMDLTNIDWNINQLAQHYYNIILNPEDIQPRTISTITRQKSSVHAQPASKPIDEIQNVVQQNDHDMLMTREMLLGKHLTNVCMILQPAPHITNEYLDTRLGTLNRVFSEWYQKMGKSTQFTSLTKDDLTRLCQLKPSEVDISQTNYYTLKTFIIPLVKAMIKDMIDEFDSMGIRTMFAMYDHFFTVNDKIEIEDYAASKDAMFILPQDMLQELEYMLKEAFLNHDKKLLIVYLAKYSDKMTKQQKEDIRNWAIENKLYENLMPTIFEVNLYKTQTELN